MLRWITGLAMGCLCALAVAQPLTENFDNVSGLAGGGWTLTNNSTAGGSTAWFQGNSAIFPSQAGGPTSYLAANFLAAPEAGNISLWAISPSLTNLRNGVTVSFYTRTEAGAPAPDSLELRMSLNGASANVGATDTSVGDFTTLLASVNPTQAASGYPETWQQYSVTLSGLPAGANTGRLALRYLVTNTTTNGDYIGVDTFVVTAAPAPDLAIAKSHTGSFTQGQTGAPYTITVTNAGVDATVGSVSVVDTLPAGLTATTIGGAGWTCTLATLTCTRSDALAGGGSYPPITLLVNVASNAPASVVNSATVSGGGDDTPGNNTANDTTTIIAVSPDLAIAKSHAGNFSQGQVGATYTLAVSNAGAASTVGIVTVVDTLPAGLTATAMAGLGWSCTVGTLTCTRSDALAGGFSYPSITLTVNVAANAAASVVNTATVSGGGDLNPANNTANDPTTITANVADLAIAKSHVGSFMRGQVGATYTIAVSNLGPGATVGTVTVVDTLPAGLTATAIAGTGWTCTLGTLTCTRSDVLGAGASYPAITLTVTVATNAAASVVNVATVSGGGDATPGNSTASDATTIIPAAAPPSNLVPVPTLGEWALLLLAAMLALLGARAARRRT